MISTARRRGFSSFEICDLLGLKGHELLEIEARFGIVPRVESGGGPGGDLPAPLILTWPEASDVLIDTRGGDEHEASTTCDHVSCSLAAPFIVPDAGSILFAHMEEGMIRRVRAKGRMEMIDPAR